SMAGILKEGGEYWAESGRNPAVRSPPVPRVGPMTQRLPFDPSAAHPSKPRLRPVRGFPAQVGAPTVLGLADARQITDKMVVAPMAARALLPLMDGSRSIGEIVAQVGQGLTPEHMQSFVAQLDDAGLLFGPRFDALLAEMRREFDSTVN